MVHLTDSPVPPEDEEPGQEPADNSSEGQGSRPSAEADEQLTAAVVGWTEALRSVQKSIDEAAAAIVFLRETIQQMAPLWRSLGGLEDALRGFEGAEAPAQRPAEIEAEPAPSQPTEPPAEEMGRDTVSAPWAAAGEEAPAEQEWGAWKRRPPTRERRGSWAESEEESAVAPSGPPRAALKPITLVPEDSPAAYSYKVTVEDPGKPIELVPLHQALSTVPAVRNLSLLSYVNGVAALSVEATDEIQLSALESAIRKTLKRSCSVLPHDENTILIQVGN